MAHILLVDDDQFTLEVIKIALENHKHNVVTKFNGMDALETFNKEDFDLIITDINMPFAVSGFDLIKSIRENAWNADVKAIFLTSRNDKKDVERAISLGVTDYFIKPIDTNLLVQKIDQLLAKTEEKNHLFQTSISVNCAWALDLLIIGISKYGLIVESTIPIPINQKIRVESDVFYQIDIKTPKLRVMSCKESIDKTKFIIKADYISMSAEDSQKIRIWCWKTLKRKSA